PGCAAAGRPAGGWGVRPGAGARQGDVVAGAGVTILVWASDRRSKCIPQKDRMMPSLPTEEVTRQLLRASDGHREALDQLTPVVYAGLRRIAQRQLGLERPGHTLDSAALVHEAYLKLVDQTGLRWQNRAHFFEIAARSMRTILIDHARARSALKRGGGATVV